MITDPAGPELLRAAVRVANSQGLVTVASYLQRAAKEHLLHGCASTADPCPHEVEAIRILSSGYDPSR